jgi:hypothetical protein
MSETATLAIMAIEQLDPEGLQQDLDFLTEQKWALIMNAVDGAGWDKAGGALQLALRQSQDNAHRVIWELGVHAGKVTTVRVGYAAQTMRPGDLNEARINDLIKKAVKAGEDELKIATDALAEARRALGV